MTAPPDRGDMVAFRYRGPMGRCCYELIGVIQDFYVEQTRGQSKPFVSKDPPFMFLSDYRLRYVVELTDPLSNLTGQRVISLAQIVEHWTPDREACD